MISYLKFLKYGSLAIVILAILGFVSLLAISDSLTIGGEILLILLVASIIYYLVLIGVTNFLLNKKMRKVIPLILLSVLFFGPFVAMLDIETAANFIFPSIDMK